MQTIPHSVLTVCYTSHTKHTQHTQHAQHADTHRTHRKTTSLQMRDKDKKNISVTSVLLSRHVSNISPIICFLSLPPPLCDTGTLALSCLYWQTHTHTHTHSHTHTHNAQISLETETAAQQLGEENNLIDGFWRTTTIWGHHWLASGGQQLSEVSIDWLLKDNNYLISSLIGSAEMDSVLCWRHQECAEDVLTKENTIDAMTLFYLMCLLKSGPCASKRISVHLFLGIRSAGLLEMKAV